MRCSACQYKFSDGDTCPACGRPAALVSVESEAVDPLLGRVLSGKFRIVEEIGVGGMGRVYRAEHLALDVDIVVKVLKPDLSENEEVIERFFREAKMAARVRHPNSVHIDDFGEDDGTLYLAMEYLRGRGLDVVLAEDGPLEADRVVDIASQVLSVLEVAHRAKIIHRDLKPENIIIENISGRDDFVKVVDFGIATVLGAPSAALDTKLTQAGTILGTPAYMAPEQVLAENIDARSDIYAVGVICFEMLVGKPPFESERIADILRAHLSSPPPAIKALRPDVPDELARAIDGALAKAPADRPQTAAAFKEQLSGPGRRRRTSSQGSIAGAKCTGCGNTTLSGAKFCSECGGPMQPSEPTDRFAGVRNLIPGLVDSVADVAQSSSSSVRDVVVAAFDIAVISLDGEVDSHVTQFARTLRSQLRDIIISNRGLFESRIAGPSIAAFGTNRSRADDPERAVRTALEARDRILASAEKASYSVTLSCCIHAGTATIDSRGAGAAFNPIDDLVELPVRLVSHAYPGRLVVSEAIRMRVERVARLRRLEPVRLLGKTTPVPCYELLSLGTPESSRGLAEPELVGRDDLVARCGALTGVVEIRGELGSGKTRVLAELAIRAKASGRVVLLARPGSSDALITAITRSLAGPDGKVRAGNAPPEARMLLDRWATGTLGTDLTQEQLDASLALALHSTLRHRESGPDTIIVDDLHHVSGSAAELMALLACEPIDDLQVFTANRAGHPPPWNGRPAPAQVTCVELELLAPGELASIIRDALAPTHAPKWLVDHAVAGAEGSPMLLMQTLASLIDCGVLGHRSWGWNIEAQPHRLPPVVGISNLLGQRVDAVPELAKRILRAIAVAVQPGGGHGRADRELIAAVVSKATEAFDEALQELRSRLLITATPGELELSSTALQDVVYTHMEERERQAWHGAMAVQLSLRGGDETDVATHFTGAGNPEKAYEWLERACARVLASSEPARAAALLEKTLMAARQIEGGERRVAIISLRLGEQWLRIGELEKLRGLLAEALPLARRIDHPALIARLQRLHARTLLARSEADRAMRELDEVVSTALVLKDARLYAEAHADLGEVHEARGNLDAAAECLVRALELSQKSDEQAVRDIALRVLNALGRVQIRRGDHDRAREFLEQALQLADEADDSIAAARALGNLAGVSHARGDYRGAIELAERALMRSRSCGDQMGAARQLNNLGSLGSLAGDAEGARRHFDEAYQTAQRIGWREGMASAAAGRQRVVR